MILLLLAVPLVGALAAWIFRHLRPVAAGLATGAVLLVAFLALWGFDTPPFTILGRTLALDPATRTHLAIAMFLLACALASSAHLTERDVAGSLALLGLGLLLLFLALQHIILAMLILQAGLAILVMLIPHKAGDAAPTNMRILVVLVMAGVLLSAAAWLIEHPGASPGAIGPMALVAGLCVILGAFPFFVWKIQIYRSDSSIARTMFGVVLPHLILVRILTLQGGALPASGGPQAALLLNVGIATFVIGCIGALAQQTIGGVLGYMAVGELGFVLMALGSDTPETRALALTHLILRGVAVVGLGVGAAALRHSFGSDRLSDLRGAFRRAPLVSLGMLLAGLSLAGFPPLAGFITRLAFYRIVAIQDLGWAVALAVIGLAPACAVVRFGIAAFQIAPMPESRREPLWPAALALLLGLGLLAVGLAPQVQGYLPANWSDLLFGLAGTGL
jgi:NADH-quinone oxidoreductase subunit N